MNARWRAGAAGVGTVFVAGVATAAVLASAPGWANRPLAASADVTTVTARPAAVQLVCPPGAVDDSGLSAIAGLPEPDPQVALAATRPSDGVTAQVQAADGAALAAQIPLTPSIWQAGPAPQALPATVIADYATLTGGQTAVASVAISVAEGLLAGLSAATCAPASADQWIVGGSDTEGNQSTLQVTNPTATAVTVDIEVWGASGAAGEGTVRPMVIAPGETQTLALGAVLPGEPRFVVHLQASGGLVVGSIVESLVDGTVARGVDIATAGSAPTDSLVIPAVEVADVSDGAGALDSDGAVVRLLAPEGAATVSLDLIDVRGRHRMVGAEEISLAAGEVLDVALTGVPSGLYTLAVTSDAPVVAAARGVRDGEEAVVEHDGLSVAQGTTRDMAWSVGRASASPDTAPGEVGTVVVPGELSSVLSVVAVPESAADVRAALDAWDAMYGQEAAATPVPEGAGSQLVGRVQGYAADGTVLVDQSLAVAEGQVLTFESAVAQAPVATWEVTVDGSSPVGAIWAVSVSDPQISGSVSTLVPQSVDADVSEIRLRRSVGIPTP